MVRIFTYVAVALMFLFGGARTSDAYELPGFGDPEFQQALEIWLSGSDESIRDIYDLAFDGNIAALAMMLHIRNSPEYHGWRSTRFTGLDGHDGGLYRLELHLRRGIETPDPVSAAFIAVLNDQDEARPEDAFTLLDSGLDDLAYAALDQIEQSWIPELLGRREIEEMPAFLQVHLYWQALQNPDASYSDALIADGVSAVDLFLEHGASFTFAVTQAHSQGADLPFFEFPGSTQYYRLVIQGSETTARAIYREHFGVDSPLPEPDHNLDAWAMSSGRTAYLRPYCNAVCPETVAQCVRAAYAANNGPTWRSRMLLTDIHPPDGILDRERFLESPRGIQRSDTALADLYRYLFRREADQPRNEITLRMDDEKIAFSPCLTARMRRVVLEAEVERNGN